MWDCSQAAIVSAWLEDVCIASDRQTGPKSPEPEPSTSRKRKAPSLNRIPYELESSNFDRKRTHMENRRSRRIAGGPKGTTEPSTPPECGGSSESLDATESGPESPTPKRPVKAVKVARRSTKTVNTAANGQQANSRELPSRSLSFPQPVPSVSSSASASASAYTGAISHRPHATTAMTSAPSFPPSESGSRRSRSPVKGMASMGWAQRPVKIVPLKRGKVPDDIQYLCEEVQKIMMGVAVVPASVRDRVDDAMPPFGMPLEDKNVDASCQRDDMSLIAELQALVWVVKATERATVQNLSEAHWNDSVHWPLLSIAIERDRAEDESDEDEECIASVFNTTQARIDPACRPQHVTEGVDLEAKMVDYCMAINDPEIECSARNAVRLQTRLVDVTASSSSAASSSAASSNASDVFSSPRKGTKAKKFPQSVNHTPDGALSMSPITVSIETKKNDGSEDVAKSQLSVWASAQILRLRQLIGSNEPLGITLPLVVVLGSTWQLLFAVEKDDRIDIIQSLSFRLDGGSNTLLGCYKILALLRALRTWSRTVFRDWFLQALPAV